MRIVVNLRVEGFHQWVGAPAPHSYLASMHRHEFHVRAEKLVTHADRDIEIIAFKRELVEFIEAKYGRPAMLGGKSCEMLALEFVRAFQLDLCEVLEDGENGAVVYGGEGQ